MPRLSEEERELRLRCLEGRTIREAVKEYERVSGRRLDEMALREWCAYNGIVPMMEKPFWSGREIRILRNNYKRYGLKATVWALKEEGFERSEQAVMRQAHNLGIRRRGC